MQKHGFSTLCRVSADQVTYSNNINPFVCIGTEHMPFHSVKAILKIDLFTAKFWLKWPHPSPYLMKPELHVES